MAVDPARGRPSRLGPKVADVVAAYRRGEKLHAIGAAFEIAPQTVVYFARSRGVPPRRPDLSAARTRRRP